MSSPIGKSLVVDTPEITEVLDLATGEISSVLDAIGEDYEKALQLRMALRQGIVSEKPLLVCPFCIVPVHLVSLPQERRFYFRHEIEDGRCPAKTKGGLSEERILAMKYDGARESAAHIRMKGILAESLRADPDFSDVQIEAIWKGADANGRRKPDVRAMWRGTLRDDFLESVEWHFQFDVPKDLLVHRPMFSRTAGDIRHPPHRLWQAHLAPDSEEILVRYRCFVFLEERDQ